MKNDSNDNSSNITRRSKRNTNNRDDHHLPLLRGWGKPQLAAAASPPRMSALCRLYLQGQWAFVSGLYVGYKGIMEKKMETTI